MNECAWCYIRADGQILRCVKSSDHKIFHYDNSDRGELDWVESDPCAWDATCQCEGDGLDAEGKDACSCGGTGISDELPERLQRKLGEQMYCSKCDIVAFVDNGLTRKEPLQHSLGFDGPCYGPFKRIVVVRDE